jgi:hypothetical protein
LFDLCDRFGDGRRSEQLGLDEEGVQRGHAWWRDERASPSGDEFAIAAFDTSLEAVPEFGQ